MRAEFDIEEEEDIIAWTRANTEFTVLEQDDRTDEECVLHVKGLSGVLGNQFGLALASKFIQGIKNPITKIVVNGHLEDRYDLGQGIKAFLRVMRDERAKLVQQQQVKGANTEFNFAQALLTSQGNMVKMIENNQRMMMEANQRMLEMVTKVVGQPKNTNQQSLSNNRTAYQSYPPRPNYQALTQGQNNSRDTSAGSRNQSSSQTGSAIQEVNHRLICYGCGNVGHMSRECPKRHQNRNNQGPPTGSPPGQQNLQLGPPQVPPAVTEKIMDAALVDTEDIYPEGIYPEGVYPKRGSSKIGIEINANMVETFDDWIGEEQIVGKDELVVTDQSHHKNVWDKDHMNIDNNCKLQIGLAEGEDQVSLL